MTTLTWPASEVTSGIRVASPLPSVACALSPGEGPHRNPKTVPNEDSLGVALLPDGAVLAVVADSHHGASAGERLVRAVLELGAARNITTAEDARTLLLDADARASSRARDRAESTCLLAILRDGELAWASLADSMLFISGPRNITRLNTPLGLFGGGTLAVRSLVSHPAYAGRTLLECGLVALDTGVTVLLASDGLEVETSGMEVADVHALLSAQEPLEHRIQAMAQRSTTRALGGGGDNVALIGMEVPR